MRPDLTASAGVTCDLIVKPSTLSIDLLSRPLALDALGAQDAEDMNGMSASNLINIPWATGDGVTIVSGSGKTGRVGAANPDTFCGSLAQSISYAHAGSNYRVTRTYAASAGA
jgi:hypothetical protein